MSRAGGTCTYTQTHRGTQAAGQKQRGHQLSPASQIRLLLFIGGNAFLATAPEATDRCRGCRCRCRFCYAVAAAVGLLLSWHTLLKAAGWSNGVGQFEVRTTFFLMSTLQAHDCAGRGLGGYCSKWSSNLKFSGSV